VAGIVLRGLLGATVLGMVSFLATRKMRKAVQRGASLTGVALGIFLAKSWANVGVEWSSNILNWFQQASTLTLLGGLRGVGTRLTLLLALLGGSLATASGKHITIDLVTRFLNPRARLPVMIVGWVGSAAICFAAAWGFLEHIAIEDFGAQADVSAGAKVGKVTSGIGEDFFIARKQIGLDLRSAPAILGGKSYSDAFTAQQWNEWLDGSGMVERYGREKVDTLKLEGDINKSPIISIPDRGEPRGELIKAANLVFPIGLAIIAIRFILLSLLAFAGHASVDPEAHIEGSDIKRRGGGPPAPEGEGERGRREEDEEDEEDTAKPPDATSGGDKPDDDKPDDHEDQDDSDDEPTAKPPDATSDEDKSDDDDSDDEPAAKPPDASSDASSDDDKSDDGSDDDQEEKK
jgi:TRAP-type C4-dicarboxylate transport system permease small subunit